MTNVTLGIWLFLASEVMLFGAFFSAYTLLRIVGRRVARRAATLLGIGHSVRDDTFAALPGRARVCGSARRLARKAQHVLMLLSSSTALLFVLAKGFEYADELVERPRAGVEHVPRAVLHADWSPRGSRRSEASWRISGLTRGMSRVDAGADRRAAEGAGAVLGIRRHRVALDSGDSFYAIVSRAVRSRCASRAAAGVALQSRAGVPDLFSGRRREQSSPVSAPASSC